MVGTRIQIDVSGRVAVPHAETTAPISFFIHIYKMSLLYFVCNILHRLATFIFEVAVVTNPHTSFMLQNVLTFLATLLLLRSISPPTNEDDGKCELVGTFSLLTQAVLGVLCILSLIVKRFYEYPLRRTWQVWFFDVSKQVIGAMGVHVFNVLLSILKTLPDVVPNDSDCGEDCTDPCAWYFLSIVLDCTIGVYVLYLLLSLVSKVCKNYFHFTQIDSGEYGPNPHKPSGKAFCKQLAIYFGSLMLTKLVLYGVVECFETELLWITVHILLAWLDEYPNEFEIFVVMFVVPIFMNCLQLILIDNFIQNQVVYLTNVKMHHEHDNRGDVDESEFRNEVERLTGVKDDQLEPGNASYGSVP